MFRLLQASNSLTERRQKLIEELNLKVHLLELDVTVVFDSYYQIGESTRSHFHNLEILFTSYAETADDLIVEEVKAEPNPRDVTVVTSDKKLAWFVRNCTAKTESVESFLKWLDKRYQNRMRKPKVKKVIAPIELIPKALPSSQLKKIDQPTLKSTLDECFNYYLETFEKETEQLFLSSAKKKEKRQQAKNKNRSPNRKPPKSNIEQGISDTERWLRLFESNGM